VDRAERSRRKPGRVDTYEAYEEGLLTEIQYDENSDGRPEKWEIFKQGALLEVRMDTNADGKPDQIDPAVSEASDQRDEPVSCDGTPVPPSQTPQFPAGDGTFPAGTAADAGVPVPLDGGAVVSTDAGLPGVPGDAGSVLPAPVTADAGALAPKAAVAPQGKSK
jgi:hypothetical protein